MVSWYLSTLKNALDEKHLVTHNMHSLRRDFPRFYNFLDAENSTNSRLFVPWVDFYCLWSQTERLSKTAQLTKNVEA